MYLLPSLMGGGEEGRVGDGSLGFCFWGKLGENKCLRGLGGG